MPRNQDDHQNAAGGPQGAGERPAADPGPGTALERSQERVRELEALYAREQAAHQLVSGQYTDLLKELEETNRGVVALYSQEHQLALTLQRTFLPAVLPALPEAALAVRYLAAADQTEIGGDFYEAVQTSAGLLLAVGDVVGHSLQAAIVMGELRHALRAYAYQGLRPHEVLERLDYLLGQSWPGWTATVCLVLIEPGAGSLLVANAGHLPPLLIGPGRSAHYVHEHGPLLGLRLPHPAATTHRLASGTTVLMVTDGLIEVPGEDLSQGLEDLREAARHAPPDPSVLCDTLLEVFGARQSDDIVVFVAHLRAVVAEPAVQRHVS